MVVQDGFSVELFNPDTGKSHKEFTKDGKTYVEAYPGGQYFIHVKCVDRSAVQGSNTVEAHFFVDEKDLGFRQYLSLNGNLSRVGLWKKDEDTRSLAFVLPKINVVEPLGSDANDEKNSTSIYSQITVCIHKSIEATPGLFSPPCPTIERISASMAKNSMAKNSISTFRRDKEPVNLDITEDEHKFLKDKKVMRSNAGTVTLKKPAASPIRKKPKAYYGYIAIKRLASPIKKKPKPPIVTKKYLIRGPHLATITLNYCSMVGLIMVGVLPKPYPGWKPTAAAARPRSGAVPPPADLDDITETITYKDDRGLEHQAIQIDLTGN